MACDIKTQKEAYNTGVKALTDSFTVNGDMTKSIRYALNEIRKNHPEVDFEVNSFVDPIVSAFKKNGFIKDSYKFNSTTGKKKKDRESKIKELADRISERDYKEKPVSKPSEFTEEEQKLRGIVSSKYGKVLNKADFDALMDQEVNGEKVKDLLEKELEEKLDEIEAKKEQKRIELEAKGRVKKESIKYLEQKEGLTNKESQKELEDNKKKIDKIVQRFDKLDDAKKSKLARNLFHELYEKGYLKEEDVLNEYAKVMGKTAMTPELKAIIETAANDTKALDELEKELSDMDKEYKDHIKNGTLTPQLKTSYISKANALVSQIKTAQKKSKASSIALSNTMKDNNFFIHDLAAMIQMNIMGIGSLERNVTSAAIDTIPRQVINFLASASTNIYETIAYRAFNRDFKTAIPIGSRFMGGLKGIVDSFKKAGNVFATGQEGFGKEIRGYDYLSAPNHFRKMRQDKGMKAVWSALAGIVKSPPDFIRRVLSSSDMLTYDPVMQGELNRIAKQKGLDEFETVVFMHNPDEESLKIATDRARNITYKDDSAAEKAVSFLTFDSRAKAAEAIKKGVNPVVANLKYGMAKILASMTIPFVKTPINIWRRANRYTVPEYTLIRTIADYVEFKKDMSSEEKRRMVAEGIATTAVGFYIRSVAIKMVAMGLISAGYGDDDEGLRDAIEQKAGGSNRFNRSAFFRGLFGMDMTERKTDVYVNNNASGLIGIVLGTYAHAFNGLNEQEKADLMNRGAISQTTTDVIGLSSVSAMLDNTFMSGVNQLLQVLREPNKKGNKYVTGALSTLITSVYPATLQKLSQTTEENRKQVYDREATLSENIHNMMGYNFFFDSKDLKDKYYSLVEEGQGLKKKRDYLLLDNNLGRFLNETVNVFKPKEIGEESPISKLIKFSREDEEKNRAAYFPQSLSKTVEFEDEDGYKYKTELNDEQYEFLTEQASMNRIISSSHHLFNEDFDKLSKEDKRKKLGKIYREGRKDAIDMLVKKHPELINEKNLKPESVSELEEYEEKYDEENE